MAMAKKAAPVKSKAKVKAPAAKGATKKAAPAKVMKKAKKVPVKTVAKVAKVKAPLKSSPKKDVKTSAMKKAEVKMVAGKSGTKEKAIALKVKAAAVVPAPVAKPLTKPLTKVAKSKGKGARVSAPKNYEAMCREIACESHHTTSGYCRLHYIKNWKKIKRKELILREKKLNQYIEELVSKYPDKYIEAIKGDLADEQAFSKVIYDLELDESADDLPSDEDGDESIIDNIKGQFDDSDTDF